MFTPFHRVLVLLTLASSPFLVRADAPLTIIVNEGNPVAAMSAAEVANYFLKKDREWPDGTTVRFIDRTDNTPERKFFLREIVKKTRREVDLYWIGQKLYSGDSAPAQVPSDSTAATLVSRFKGGISYVSPDFQPTKGVKKIQVSGAE